MTEDKSKSRPQFALCFKDLASFMRIEMPKVEDKNDESIEETNRIIDIKP